MLPADETSPAPDRESDVSEPQPEPTGNPTVDAVLASLDCLEERPVAEHVAVFEAAHEALRGALADAGNHPTA